MGEREAHTSTPVGSGATPQVFGSESQSPCRRHARDAYKRNRGGPLLRASSKALDAALAGSGSRSLPARLYERFTTSLALKGAFFFALLSAFFFALLSNNVRGIAQRRRCVAHCPGWRGAPRIPRGQIYSKAVCL